MLGIPGWGAVGGQAFKCADGDVWPTCLELLGPQAQLCSGVNHISLHRSSGEAVVQAWACTGVDLFVLIIAGTETFLCGLVWSIVLELKRTLLSQLAATPVNIPQVPGSWAGAGRGEM